MGAYGGGNEVKTMPGSTTNTKRNSIAANIVSSEKSMRGSGNKNDHKRARNSDQLRTKQQSRHKRKANNGGLSSTQQNLSESV